MGGWFCVDVDPKGKARIIDLDVDIGADAVDYKYALLPSPPPPHVYLANAPTPRSAIANQESLSALETEMRKLEGIVKEIVDELGYLKKREERFQSTNSASSLLLCIIIRLFFCFRGLRYTLSPSSSLPHHAASSRPSTRPCWVPPPTTSAFSSSLPHCFPHPHPHPPPLPSNPLLSPLPSPRSLLPSSSFPTPSLLLPPPFP